MASHKNTAEASEATRPMCAFAAHNATGFFFRRGFTLSNLLDGTHLAFHLSESRRW